MSPRMAVGLLGVGCVVVMWLVSHLYRMLLDAYEQLASLNDIEYSWFFRLLLNLLGYSTVLLPMFLCYKYLERTNYFDKITTSTSVVSRALFTCFGEPGERLPETGKSRREEGAAGAGAGAGAGGAREGAELAFCFTGLMGSYLVWGLLQEKIMTTVQIRAVGRQHAPVHGLAVPGVREPSDGAAGGGRAAGLRAGGRGRGGRGAGAGRAAVPAQLLRAHQRAERLVPVRGAQVRQLPHAGAVQVVQGAARDADGQAGVAQQVRAVRVRDGRAHLRRDGHVHVRQPRRRRRVERDDGVGAVPAGAVHGVRQLHVVVAGRGVRAHGLRPAADAVRRQLVLHRAHRRRASLQRHLARAAHAPGVRGGLRGAVAELDAGPAVHLPHHRALRRRRLHHHHDAPTGGVDPAVVRGVRARGVGRRRGGRAGRVRGRAAASVLPPAHAPRARRQGTAALGRGPLHHLQYTPVSVLFNEETDPNTIPIQPG